MTLIHEMERDRFFVLFLALGLICSFTGCRGNDMPQPENPQPQLRSFYVLLPILERLRVHDTDPDLVFSIEDFLNEEIVRVARDHSFMELHPQDQRVLQSVKHYWQAYSFRPRRFPETEQAWLHARTYLEDITPEVFGLMASDQSKRPTLQYVRVPRQLMLTCLEKNSKQLISNITVAVDGPAQFVSLISADADEAPGSWNCRFVLQGGSQLLETEPSQQPYDSSVIVHFLIRAPGFMNYRLSIPANDLAQSEPLRRAVLLDRGD